MLGYCLRKPGMPEERSCTNQPIITKNSDYYSVNREIAVSLEQRDPRVVVQPALPGRLNPLIPNMTPD